MGPLVNLKTFWKQLGWPFAVYRAAVAAPFHLSPDASHAADQRLSERMMTRAHWGRARPSAGDAARVAEALHPYSWLVTAARVNGTPVFDHHGHPAGHLSDLSLDRASGQAVYALVAIGGAVGEPELFYPLPWWLLTYDRRKQGYVVPVPVSTVQAGPCLTRDEMEWFGADDSAWRERLAIYYSPYASPAH